VSKEPGAVHQRLHPCHSERTENRWIEQTCSPSLISRLKLQPIGEFKHKARLSLPSLAEIKANASGLIFFAPRQQAL
jgi:hypothetical protein